VAITLPLHAQLHDELVQQIITGALPTGSRIPSERELCERFNVSRTTTRRTISELVHEGWVYTVVGKGTYVARNLLEQELQSFTGFSDDLNRRGISVTSRVLAAENIKAPPPLAQSLHLPVLAPVFQLHRLRLTSGTALAIQRTTLPEHLCPGLLQFDFTSGSLYDILRSRYGLRLVRGQATIRAGLATPSERSLLKLGNPGAVLRTYQTTFLDDDRPIEYCESVFHGELYELVTTINA
jgi:GntR family transcriptional regulator